MRTIRWITVAAAIAVAPSVGAQPLPPAGSPAPGVVGAPISPAPGLGAPVPRSPVPPTIAAAPSKADLVAAARQEANSPAGRYSRRRRQHVMEGNFADAVNNHGAKKARWRGLGRQRIQSWLIAAVQNLRIFLRHQLRGPVRAAAAALAAATEQLRVPAVTAPDPMVLRLLGPHSRFPLGLIHAGGFVGQ